MNKSNTTMNSQTSREVKRKAQLRDAQRRLRQRKVDELKDVNSEIESLRKQLAEAKETIARMSAQDNTPVSNESVTPAPSSHQLLENHRHDFGLAHGTNAQVNSEDFTIDDTTLGQFLSPLSPSTFESFFPGASDDLLSLDMADAFHFPQATSKSEQSSSPGDISNYLDQEPNQIWPLGYIAVTDERMPYMPLSAHQDSSSSLSAQLFRQLNPISYTIVHEPTFAKRLWRRCAEMALRMLADTRRHQAALERAFGAYIDRFSPEKVRKSLISALGQDNFDQLEYRTYPNFDFGHRSRILQGTSVEEYMISGQSNSQDDPYMTPRDIQNFYVSNGQLRQSVDPKGNIVTSPCHFDYQGKRWILEENKLIHILMQFSVCLGQGPALLASHVIAATFQSMQRVAI
ncbi:hypothetical protein KCU65_g2441, partial [Aureobasidium melanogenum]